MKIPKIDVRYIPAFHNEEEGGTPFCLDGTHYRSKREAFKELKRLYSFGHTHFFIAEVTIKRATLSAANPSQRKAA